MDDNATRLACYDSRNPPNKSAARTQGSASRAAKASVPATAADVPAPPANAPPPAASAPATPASRAEPGSDFGLTQKREWEAAKTKAAEPDLIAQVASVSEKLTGELLLKLDNGQSWVQAQRKSDVFIKAGEHVTISRGTFGGYLLSSDSGATMRVRRLE